MPLFLYGIWTVFGVNLLVAKLFIALFAALNVVLVAMVARRLFDERAALLAAAAAAFYPGFIYWTGTLGSETLTMTFLLATVLCLLHERWALAGVAAALAIQTRPVFLPWVAFLALWILLRQRRPLAVRPAAVYTLAVALTMLPWVVRNGLDRERP